MSRHIDADALIEDIKKGKTPPLISRSQLLKMIENRPTIPSVQLEQRNVDAANKLADMVKFNRFEKAIYNSGRFTSLEADYAKNVMRIFEMHNVDYLTWLSITKDLNELSKMYPPDIFQKK